MNDDIYLVTGASGYVGSEMVKYLQAQGIKVRAMLRDISKSKDINLPGVELIKADLQDAASLEAAVKGVSGIYHIASIFRQAGLPEAVFDDINFEGVRRLFDAAIRAGVKRIVHCSTGGVLGHVANPPGSDKSPYNPGDMYQRSKLKGEILAMDYFRSGKMRGVVIRPAMVYGPGDTRNWKLFKMIARKRFFYVGKGNAHVHFIDVRDLVRAFYLAMQKTDLNAQIYHIPGEKAVPLTTMVNLIADHLHVPRPWLHLPVKPVQWLGSLCELICTPFRIQPPIYKRRVDFFTKNRHFDISKAQSELGFKPAKPFEDELIEITDWYRKHSWI